MWYRGHVAFGSWREQRSGSADASSRSLHRRHVGASVSGGGAPSPNDVPLPTLATAATDGATIDHVFAAETLSRNASRPLANVDASSTANKSSHQGDRVGQPTDRRSSGARRPAGDGRGFVAPFAALPRLGRSRGRPPRTRPEWATWRPSAPPSASTSTPRATTA
ncbi:hypothetical protein MRX96_003383 [Rhipicephalus microplus]